MLEFGELGIDDVGDRSSLAPLARKTEKATTGSPSRRANERCSLAPSMTRAEIVEADLAPAGQHDLRVGQVFDASRAGKRADRLLLAADLAPAAAEIDVGGAHLVVDLAAVMPSASSWSGSSARGFRGRRRRSARPGRRP